MTITDMFMASLFGASFLALTIIPPLRRAFLDLCTDFMAKMMGREHFSWIDLRKANRQDRKRALERDERARAFRNYLLAAHEERNVRINARFKEMENWDVQFEALLAPEIQRNHLEVHRQALIAAENIRKGIEQGLSIPEGARFPVPIPQRSHGVYRIEPQIKHVVRTETMWDGKVGQWVNRAYYSDGGYLDTPIPLTEQEAKLLARQVRLPRSTVERRFPAL